MLLIKNGHIKTMATSSSASLLRSSGVSAKKSFTAVSALPMGGARPFKFDALAR